MNPTFNELVVTIIKEQELVIGPLAWTEAKKVTGLAVDINASSASIEAGDPKVTVDRLVAQYERLFGPASQEVCRDAVATMVAKLSATEIPTSLK